MVGAIGLIGVAGVGTTAGFGCEIPELPMGIVGFSAANKLLRS